MEAVAAPLLNVSAIGDDAAYPDTADSPDAAWAFGARGLFGVAVHPRLELAFGAGYTQHRWSRAAHALGFEARAIWLPISLEPQSARPNPRRPRSAAGLRLGLGPSLNWERAPEFPAQRAETLLGVGGDARLGPVVNWQLNPATGLTFCLEAQLGTHRFSNASGYLQTAAIIRTALNLVIGARIER